MGDYNKDNWDVCKDFIVVREIGGSGGGEERDVYVGEDKRRVRGSLRKSVKMQRKENIEELK